MQQFLFGFMVGILAVVLAVFFFLRRKKQKPEPAPNEHQRQLEELSKLTGGLAHEIKNPLSTIKVNLKLISEDISRNSSVPSSEQSFQRAIRKIGIIQKETDRLEQILDSFLRYVDRGKLHFARADINSLVSNMIDFYSPQAQSHSITMRSVLYEKPLDCKIDSDMLKQVILNLFINAQQAMQDGGELMVQTLVEGENAVIRISDTGTGIEADKVDKIFDAYFSSRPQGMGLGLPTAKKIIEAHNGTIYVDSALGKGTSFTIKLLIAEH